MKKQPDEKITYKKGDPVKHDDGRTGIITRVMQQTDWYEAVFNESIEPLAYSSSVLQPLPPPAWEPKYGEKIRVKHSEGVWERWVLCVVGDQVWVKCKEDDSDAHEIELYRCSPIQPEPHTLEERITKEVENLASGLGMAKNRDHYLKMVDDCIKSLVKIVTEHIGHDSEIEFVKIGKKK